MECSPCLRGHYCSNETTSEEAMLSVMVCPPGFLCSQGLARDPQRSATLCPRGFYCPGGGIVSQRLYKYPPKKRKREEELEYLRWFSSKTFRKQCRYHFFPRIQTQFLALMGLTVNSLDCVMPQSVSSVPRGSTVTPSSRNWSPSPHP